ncbi:MAG: mucoidy inhibitor MuiA family protein, partial [Verrucomicrobiae bacterium]|nr:mucoidy inhibitor MuiA family protein [Verrucomicrobiae bacterium]
MKRFLIPLITGILVQASLPAQTSVDSTITKIDVYSGTARVTRSSEVNLVAGENVLLFSGLPSQLDANQVQAAIAGNLETRLDNLKFQLIKDREDSAEEKRLKDAIEELRARIQVLDADKKQQGEKLSFASSLSTSFTKGFGEADPSPDSMRRAEEVLEFQQKVMRETQSAIPDLEKKIADLDKETKELVEDLNEETNRVNRLQGEVTVRLFSAASGPATLDLNYLVPNANWFPSYAVRVNSASNGMEIVYQANIWQDSGEDWKDVAVNVSTSQPNRSGNVPEMPPVYLQPNEYRPRSAPSADVYELSPFEIKSKDDRGYEAKQSLAGTRAQTTVQTGMSSFSATLPTRVTLESQNEPSRFPMLTASFKSEFWSEAVPLLQERGFLKAKTLNAFDLPLIPGQAQVFIDGALTSRVTVPYALPGDELELSLGVDDFIIVNRKETLRETEYAGLIDKTTVLKRAYTIEVTNFHPLAHKVKAFERFPISRNEKIVVKRQTPSNLGDRIE